jgi:hypothetical protein
MASRNFTLMSIEDLYNARDHYCRMLDTSDHELLLRRADMRVLLSAINAEIADRIKRFPNEVSMEDFGPVF